MRRRCELSVLLRVGVFARSQGALRQLVLAFGFLGQLGKLRMQQPDEEKEGLLYSSGGRTNGASRQRRTRRRNTEDTLFRGESFLLSGSEMPPHALCRVGEATAEKHMFLACQCSRAEGSRPERGAPRRRLLSPP